MGLNEVLGNPLYDLLNYFEDDDSLSPFPNGHSTPYLNVNEFSKLILPSKFSLVSLNVRSIKSKFDDITSFVNECNNSDN